MRFAEDVDDAVDELWELSLDTDKSRAVYAAPRHFAALVAVNRPGFCGGSNL
jgi:hypothetical protein